MTQGSSRMLEPMASAPSIPGWCGTKHDLDVHHVEQSMIYICKAKHNLYVHYVKHSMTKTCIVRNKE